MALLWNTLAEILARLEKQTGEQWSARELFDLALAEQLMRDVSPDDPFAANEKNPPDSTLLSASLPLATSALHRYRTGAQSFDDEPTGEQRSRNVIRTASLSNANLTDLLIHGETIISLCNVKRGIDSAGAPYLSWDEIEPPLRIAIDCVGAYISGLGALLQFATDTSESRGRPAPAAQHATNEPRKREDLMAETIEAVIAELGSAADAPAIMRRLKQFAGTGATCIRTARSDGVEWIDTSGKQQVLNREGLRKRLSRRAQRLKWGVDALDASG